jgi:hypothetical protein
MKNQTELNINILGTKTGLTRYDNRKRIKGGIINNKDAIKFFLVLVRIMKTINITKLWIIIINAIPINMVGIGKNANSVNKAWKMSEIPGD